MTSTRESRTLAVLFADICNSTLLYQRMGDAAAQAVVEECLALVGEVAHKYSGRVVKPVGDAALCVFQTADSGVLAASAMQAQVQARRPGRQPLKLHVGLHYGPVLIEQADVFGDTVNAAAYLTAVAAEDQILTTESVEAHLSDGLKAAVRPIFRTLLKGSSQESNVFQVLWEQQSPDLTDVNLASRRRIPGDTGSLLLACRDRVVRVDQRQPQVVVGRGDECGLVVADKFASRQHMTVRLLRTHFYIVDHSINGTFVTLENGDEVHVLRGEMLLDGGGRICLGRSRTEGASEVIVYKRDRRSMYRVG